LIEGLAHLDRLKAERFFFMGLPSRVKGCDAWPIRAIAIEGVL
jgi:kynurenine formamidase